MILISAVQMSYLKVLKVLYWILIMGLILL